MALSYQAVSGTDGSMAMLIQGSVAGKKVLILIDSGSTSSFITKSLAVDLPGIQSLDVSVSVKVAGGGRLTCSQFIPQRAWTTQQQEFRTDLKILQLGTYDMILGYDWLTHFSPMNVDWARKKMRIVDQNTVVNLCGIQSDTSSCPTISLQECSALFHQDEVSHVVQLNSISVDADSKTLPEVQ